MRGWRDIETDNVVEILGEAGSLESSNAPQRCGARPWACQIFRTVELVSSTALAIARAVQWIPSDGGGFSVIAPMAIAHSSATALPGGQVCRGAGRRRPAP